MDRAPVGPRLELDHSQRVVQKEMVVETLHAAGAERGRKELGMRADSLRQWLADRGCRFDEHEHERGEGHASVTARHGDRAAVIPMVNTKNDLDWDDVRRIVTELGFDWRELPGPQSRVQNAHPKRVAG